MRFDGNTAISNVLELSGDEQNNLMIKFADLLSEQVGRYNGMDSSSVQIEKAKEIFSSLMYTFWKTVNHEGLSKSEIFGSNLMEIISRGQKLVIAQKNEVFELWNQILIKSPQLPNCYYVDTIKEIGSFFDRYDVYYFANQIPCSIDYPLISPVSEECEGIDYINEYLHRIEIENKFINKFNLDKVCKILNKNAGNYKEHYMNLCETVYTNCLGCFLINKDIFSLELSEDDVSSIRKLIIDKDKQSITSLFESKSYSMLKELDLINPDEVCYFDVAADALSVRVYHTKEEDGFNNIFTIDN